MKTIVSLGMGVNSIAMLVGLALRGQRPDAILFADTGGEKPETYAWLPRVQCWCEAVGFPEMEIVRYNSRHATLENECLRNDTLPSKAFGNGGCSVKWKRQPLDKWIESQDWAQAEFAAGRTIQRLIGIHAGEFRRGQIPNTERYEFAYPLRQWQWAQADCERACLVAFQELPPKSACFFCPAMKKHEVLKLAETHPDLFERAVEIEDNARDSGNLETVKGLGRNWSWSSLKKADDAQRRMFHDVVEPHCASGDCGT